MGLLYMFTLYSGAVSLVIDLLFSSPRQFPLHRLAGEGSALEWLFQSCPACIRVWGLGGDSHSLTAIHGEGGMSVIAGMQSSPPHHVSHTDQGNPLANSYKASSNATTAFILSYLATDQGASGECFRIRNRTEMLIFSNSKRFIYSHSL